MQKLLLLTVFACILSCKKSTAQTDSKIAKINADIDSINTARTKYNDSIRILNAKNHFRDLSGPHKFTHSSLSNAGTVNFTNNDRDLYNVSGKISSGKNYVKIEGEIKMVSEKYLNFDGKVTQRIQENDNGKVDVRSKKTSFVRNGDEPFWRFQNRVNSSGSPDNIDIYR